jgi:integrase
MKAAKGIGPVHSLRPAVIYTLVGLLYATGLRIGEARKLTLADVDLRRRLLTIRRTKFQKTRYVPMSESTTRALAAFMRKRQAAGFSTNANSAVFVNPEGQAYGHPRLCTLFLEIVRKIGLRGPSGQDGARIHDFRHYAGSRTMPGGAVAKIDTAYLNGLFILLQAHYPA